MSVEKYNGFTNYETWAVKLWIDNEEATSNHWNRVATHIYLNEAREQKYFSKMEDAIAILSEKIREAHFSAAHDAMQCAMLDNSLYMDMINASLSEVNWHEVARCLLEGIDTRHSLV